MKKSVDNSIVGKLNLLTPTQKKLILNTEYKYIKIMLLDWGKKTERLYVSSQSNPGTDIYETEHIRKFLPQ